MGTNSHVVFVVCPNHRWSLYVLGFVHTTIWLNSLTGSCLELAAGNSMDFIPSTGAHIPATKPRPLQEAGSK